MNNYCPECRTQLINHANKCPCGWKKPMEKTNRFRCQYISHQKRCEKEGTMCKYVRADLWYCREHYGSDSTK